MNSEFQKLSIRQKLNKSPRLYLITLIAWTIAPISILSSILESHNALSESSSHIFYGVLGLVGFICGVVFFDGSFFMLLTLIALIVVAGLIMRFLH